MKKIWADTALDDVNFDTVANWFGEARSSSPMEARHLTTVLSLPALAQTLWTSQVGEKKALFAAAGLRPSEEK